mmetsp:Transcript_25806/g.68259  ORF Transcript_25806/g.68259 Transcript_25806/m.68259 type:complete len:306 (-) Transcript_25806:399-1316(-)
MRHDFAPVGTASPRIVLEIPPLPAIEVLLFIITILLFRLIWLISEGLIILRRGVAKDGLAFAVGDKEERPVRTRGRSASGTPPQSKLSARVLRTSHKMFEQCYLGDEDIDVGKFIEASLHYGDKVLTRMGSFTVITVREIHANVDKIKHTYQLNPDKYRSMQALLEAECTSDMHQPGGLLSDPSAAMGLLWARRGLLFWVCLFKKRIDQAGSRPGTPTAGKSEAALPAEAFEEAMASYTGWVTRNTFMLATRAFPGWQEIELAWAPDREDAITDMTDFVNVLDPLLDRMDNIIRTLDLNDQRKSI